MPRKQKKARIRCNLWFQEENVVVRQGLEPRAKEVCQMNIYKGSSFEDYAVAGKQIKCLERVTNSEQEDISEVKI